jgi:hypothetical protein
MTLTAQTSARDTNAATVDLYRDIHKGIRAELFALTGEAGRIDPASGASRAAVAGQVRGLVQVLETHADHEDTAIGPVLEQHLPHLAERIGGDHARLAGRTAQLVDRAEEAALSGGAGSHQLYLDLAEFTGVYLVHQDVEERVVLQALSQVVGPDAVMAIHAAIIASIPPDQMARSLAFMLPAMNVNGRAELLGGMQAAAPPQVFEGVWGLAASVLTPADHAAVGARLGLA